MTLTLTQPVSHHNGIKRAEVEIATDSDAQEVAETFRILMKAMTFGDEIIRDILPTEEDYEKLAAEENEWCEGSEPPVDDRWVIGYWPFASPPHALCRYTFNHDANITDDAYEWRDSDGGELAEPQRWQYIDEPGD